MKRMFVIAIAAITLGFTFVPSSTVFVCGNSTTKVYHLKESCHGLKRCTYETIKMTREDAKSKGLRVCGYED